MVSTNKSSVWEISTAGFAFDFGTDGGRGASADGAVFWRSLLC